MEHSGITFCVYASVVYLVSTFQYAAAATGYGPIIETNKGRVKGQRIRVHGMEVDVFYGIPYAKPPIGELRFKHPQPIDPWSGVINATIRPNACWQGVDTVYGNFSGANVWNPNTVRSEDCLYLNVWVPRTGTQNKHVMVWIFGGGFFSGSSSLDIYDAKYLVAQNDVIVVSMQYRLGALGFLALYHREAMGNAGMFDQVMALDWVQQNIHTFGGNPHQVTLFGESAGAVSVGMHLLSPISRGKFQKAIMQSGGPQAGWAVLTEQEAKHRAMKLANAFSCDHPEVTTVIDCLRNVPAEQFPDKEWNVIEYGIVRFPFVPIVDGAFLSQTPEKSLNSNNFKKCPILIGSNTNEASYWMLYENTDLFSIHSEAYISQHKFNILMDNYFAYHPYYPKKLNDFGKEAILFQYRYWQNPNDQIMNRHQLDMAVGDYNFICPTVDLAQHYASTGNNVYYYVYDHRASTHKWPEWMGVLHGDEINFVFGEPFDERKRYTHEEKVLARKMMTYWTNFAKTGDPNRAPGDISIDEWPVYDNVTRKSLVLRADLINQVDKSRAIREGPRTQQCAFWKEYLPNLVMKTADMTEMELEWKVQFNEWRTKYIVDWKHQFDTFLTDHSQKTQQCQSP